MEKIKSTIRDFLLIISSNAISFAGALVTTTATFVFFLFLGVSLFNHNNYIGILGFLIIPMFFTMGLLLIPLGYFLYRKKLGFTNLKEVSPSNFMEKLKISKPRGVLSVITFLTLINMVILAVAGYQSFHYMESNQFCGTLCHKVMIPEYTAYQDSPHSRVPCVDCHIGEGADWFVKSKLAGTNQLINVIFDTYHKPIKTPLHNLRPAHGTCEQCHWPDKFHGERIRNIIHYGDDEKNTPKQTVLLLKVGSGSRDSAHGIHWHVSKDSEVKYISEEDKRENIKWISLTNEDGKVVEWTKEDFKPSAEEMKNARVMDCIDCHNRATHTYDELKPTLDRAMTMGIIKADLPFIRKQAEKFLTKTTVLDKEEAVKKIQSGIMDYYKNEYPSILKTRKADIEKAIAEIVRIYRRNIHPDMHITWGSYPNHIGHTPDMEQFPGCFRCHNYDLVSKEGNNISQDCDLCHSLIRYDQPKPKEIKKLFVASE